MIHSTLVSRYLPAATMGGGGDGTWPLVGRGASGRLLAVLTVLAILQGCGGFSSGIDAVSTPQPNCPDHSKMKMCSDGSCVSIMDPCKADGDCGLGKRKCKNGMCLHTFLDCPGEAPAVHPSEPGSYNDYNEEEHYSERELSSKTSLYYITIPLGVILVVSSIACRACKKTSAGQRRYHSWRQSFRESVTRRGGGGGRDCEFAPGAEAASHMRHAAPASAGEPPGGYASMEPCYPHHHHIAAGYYEKTSPTYPLSEGYIPPGAPKIYPPPTQHAQLYPCAPRPAGMDLAADGESPFTPPRSGNSPRRMHSPHSELCEQRSDTYHPISAHPPSYKEAIKTANQTLQ